MADKKLKLTHEGTRTLVSLLLFMHLFCVLVVLSAAFNPSALQQRLANIFAPWSKTLHLDPQHVTFHLTTGEEGDQRLHQWQVLADGKIVLRLPQSQSAAGFQRTRIDAFAALAGKLVSLDVDEEIPAVMARDVAQFAVKQGLASSQDQLLVRCIRFLDAADPATVTPDSMATETLYQADAWASETGEMMVLKRDDPRRTAPPASTDSPN